MSLVSGMASVSENVSFGITGSTSYINVRGNWKYPAMELNTNQVSPLSWQEQHLPSIMLPKDDLHGML